MSTKITATRLLELQKMLFDFSEIDRLIYLPDSKKLDRRENNSEHSYSLSMAAWYLSSFYPHINKDLVIKYALIHDLVELHAGDEQAIGRTDHAEALKSKREHEALVRLEQDWADFADMTGLIAQYEKKSDPESKFVYALDKLMPMLLNILSRGKTWKKYDFSKQDIFESKDKRVAQSPEINEIWQVFRASIDKDDGLFNQK